MDWIRYVAVAVVNTVGVVVGIIFVPSPPALAQSLPSQEQIGRPQAQRDESKPFFSATPSLEMTQVSPQSLEELSLIHI